MALDRERLEQLVARSTDVVVATDRRGRVIYYNDGASRILGYKPAEVLGTFVAKLYPSLEEAKRVMEAMRSAGYGGRDSVDSFQTSFLSKDGEVIPVAISGTLLRDEAGGEAGTIGFAKDLRAILRKDQLATLGEVAIGLSHEINNPLAVLLNQLDLLETDVVRRAGDNDCSIETERLDAMRREIGRIAEILERLSKIAAGEQYETVEYIGPARMIDLRRRYEAVAGSRLEGLRVLVVDDDLGICRTLKEILETQGCGVETASDGAEGLRRAESSTFDVVLTDVVMPNMDGYELYQALRERYPKLPVLMMTAFTYDRDHVIKRSRMEGLQGVLFKKPVDPKRLIDVLAEATHR